MREEDTEQVGERAREENISPSSIRIFNCLVGKEERYLNLYIVHKEGLEEGWGVGLNPGPAEHKRQVRRRELES